jgi:ABC-type nitrate/sulfonate/bicarbonate transport system substrate-binding protein
MQETTPEPDREDTMRTQSMRRWRTAAILAAGLMLGLAGEAGAADSISVGKAAAVAWTFTPLDVGIEMGIFKKHGFDEIKVVNFAGDARLQQGLGSKSIEFGLGSGPAMAFAAKGNPVRAVAAFGNEPRNLSVAVPYDSTLTVADLKGKILGVTTAGSLTEWLAKRLAISRGWGPDGIRVATVGGAQSSLAAVKTKQIDGMVTAYEFATMLQDRKEMKPIYVFSDLVKEFHTHVIFARTDLIAEKADMVQRFVNGWFDTIAYVKQNKAKVVEISSRVLKTSPAIIGHVYDIEIGMLSDTGVFDRKAVEVLKESYVGMGLLDTVPADDAIFTTRFVPAKR